MMDIILVLSLTVLNFCLSVPIRKQEVGASPGLCPHPISSLSFLASLVKANIGCEAKNNRRTFFPPLPSLHFLPLLSQFCLGPDLPPSPLHLMEALSTFVCHILLWFFKFMSREVILFSIWIFKAKIFEIDYYKRKLTIGISGFLSYSKQVRSFFTALGQKCIWIPFKWICRMKSEFTFLTHL